MGFKEVFLSLKEVFPKVDLRILKAVAIEHPRDVDAAVEFILSEVLPLMSEKSEESDYVYEKQAVKNVSPSRDISISEHVKSSNMLGDQYYFLTASLTKQSSQNASRNHHEPVEDVVASVHASGEHLMPQDLVFESHASSSRSNFLDVTSSNVISSEYQFSSRDVTQENDLMENFSSLHKKTVDDVISSVVIDVHKSSNFGAINTASDNIVNAESFSSSQKDFGSSHSKAAVDLEKEGCSSEPQVQVLGCVMPSKPDFRSHTLDLKSNFLNATITGGISSEDMIVEQAQLSSSGEHHGVTFMEDTTSLRHNIIGNAIDGVDMDEHEVPKFGVGSIDFDSHADAGRFLSSASRKALDAPHSEAVLVSEIKNGSEAPEQTMQCAVMDDCALEATCSRFEDCSSTLSSSLINGSTDFTRCLVIDKDLSYSTSECEQKLIWESDDGAGLFSFETDAYFVDSNNPSIKAAPRSTQLPTTDVLEECIFDARNSKKMLVTSIDSVFGMMEEVEDAEAKAAETKDEAASAGQDTFAKVEELRQMLKHAKEANGMNAGEVYGERCILASEAQELQSRLLSLSEDRDIYLSIIGEIRDTLSERLAAAKEELEVAAQEKARKEELAHRAFEEQELIMENIVQESKKLQQLADENLKLREFLTERGNIVDTLKGEMAVIYEDVTSLKSSVDKRVPLRNRFTTLPGSMASSVNSSYYRSMSSNSASHSHHKSKAEGVEEEDGWDMC